MNRQPRFDTRGRRRLWPLLASGLLSLWVCLGCETLPARTARDDGVQKVLLMPMNLTERLPLGLEGGLKALTLMHVEYLEAHGLSVDLVPLAEAHAAWTRAANRAESGGAEAAAPYLARALAERHDFDLVVIPDIVSGPLRVTHRPTKWDGVKRSVRVVDPTGRVLSASVLNQRGTGRPSPTGRAYVESNVTVTIDVTASSLRVLALDPSGQAAFRGRGGLDLVHEVYWLELKRTRHYRIRLRADLLRDPNILAESLRVAYTPYLEPLAFHTTP